MNNYHLLRPYTDIEKCACAEITSLVLVDLLSANPIQCMSCRREIDPELLELESQLVNEIHHWFGSIHALYMLWLNSGQYEKYAKKQLLSKSGQVNVKGIELAKKMSAHYPTYFWWFSDTDDGIPDSCPNCSRALNPNVKFGTGKCEQCNVVV